MKIKERNKKKAKMCPEVADDKMAERKILKRRKRPDE